MAHPLPNVPNPITPLFITIEDTKRVLNLCHGTVYKLLREGKITAVKHGSKTLVRYESVRDYANSLPAPAFVGA